MILVLEFSYLLFAKWRGFPIIPKFAKSFEDKWVLNFVKSFFGKALCVCMIFFYFSVNVLNYTDSLIFESPLYSWDNLNQVVVYYPLLKIQFVSIFLRVFVFMLMSDIGLYFFSLYYPLHILVSVTLAC